MTDDTSPPSFREISLRQLLDRAQAGWRTPVIFAVIAIVLALISLSMARPVYLVEMSVVPAPSSQTETGMSSSGGLTSLLGLAGGGQNSSYTRYQKLLTSTVVAERMQQKYDMLHVVFADLWDKKQKKWVQPVKLRDTLLGWLFALSHVPVWTPPDITDLAAYLQGNILIVPSVQSDIVAISSRHPDPVFARRLLLMAHTEANIVLRDQVAARATQQVAYLQRKLGQTTVEDYRQTLLSLLSAQEKTLMLTQTSAPYAAEVLTPPVFSARPVAPRPVLTIAVAILVGVLAGVSVVVFFGPDWWSRPRQRFGALRAALRRGRRGA
jgi:uncharacterized protein involved in exopolysaccharide biosynthesis